MHFFDSLSFPNAYPEMKIFGFSDSIINTLKRIDIHIFIMFYTGKSVNRIPFKAKCIIKTLGESYFIQIYGKE